jgi:hypothetical protein
MHIFLLFGVLFKIFLVDYVKELADVTAKHMFRAKKAIRKHNTKHAK